MKRLIWLVLLLMLLTACSKLINSEAALKKLAFTCSGYTVVSSKNSDGANTLNDSKVPTLDQINDATTWHYRGDFSGSTGFPMEVVLDLGGRYDLENLIYNVGRIVEPSKAKLIVEISDDKKFSGPETALTLPAKAYGAEVFKEVSGTGRYLRLSFRTNAQRFDISELEVCGEAAPTTSEPPTGSSTYFDILGMNYTWFHAEYPNKTKVGNGKTNRAKEVAKNARWFLVGMKDYGEEQNREAPGTYELKPCEYSGNTWDCPEDEKSPRQNLVRINRLLEAHKGLIFLAPESPIFPLYPEDSEYADYPDLHQYAKEEEGRRIFVYRQWPGKSWTAAELTSASKSAFDSGFQYADAYFKSLASLEDEDEARIVLAMTNEEWLRNDKDGTNRKAAYDQYRLGFIEAHKQHRAEGGKVAIATGARQMDNRVISWVKPDGTLTESIRDLEVKTGKAEETILDYIDSVGGYTSIHIHDRIPSLEDPNSEAIYQGDVKTSYGIRQLKAMREWLNANGYGNIKIYVGELSFTFSAKNKLPENDAARKKDASVLKNFVREASKYTGDAPIFLYQVDDHQDATGKIVPEGEFTGTNYGTDYANQYDVVEDLIDFSKENVD